MMQHNSLQHSRDSNPGLQHKPAFFGAANAAGKRQGGNLFFQGKLTVNNQNDHYEKEADAMADTVMRKAAQPEPFFKPSIHKSSSTIHRKCAACGEEEVQRKPLADSITPIQRSSETTAAVSSTVESSIHQTKGNGNPLPASLREKMELGFGTDFSSVHIHTDDTAVQLSRELNAKAFTTGNDIYFNSGAYNPAAADGQRLLAHELTHVVQQAGTPSIQRFTDLELECRTLRGPCRSDSQEFADATEAKRRMEQTPAGQTLLDDLRTQPHLQNSTITANFATNIVTAPGEMGRFDPEIIGADAYRVSINLHASGHNERTRSTQIPADGSMPAPTSVYGGGGVEIPTCVTERPSLMAETLYHELLHVWYLNQHGNTSIAGSAGMYQSAGGSFTGHNDASIGEIDPAFARRLQSFARDIFRVETTVPPPTVPAETEQPTAPPPTEAVPRERGSRSTRSAEPAPVGFRAGVQAGYYNLPTGITGEPADQFGIGLSAGIVFGTVVRLGISGQALYMPSIGLFGIGGGLNLQVLQQGDAVAGLAPNPIFFDIDARAAYVIPSGSILISPSAGVGVETGGNSQWRFYFRAGGGPEIMIGPGGTTAVGGSATATGGVAF
jgi:Domain of unknown function (DUF4157)